MLSIILATIASVLIGGLWFGPKTFFPVMMNEMNQDEAEVSARMERFNPSFHFGLVILGELTLAVMIYGLLLITNGDLMIIIFPIFFVLVSNIKTNIFTYLNFKLFLIQEGEKVLSMLVMGLIIGLMM